MARGRTSTICALALCAAVGGGLIANRAASAGESSAAITMIVDQGGIDAPAGAVLPIAPTRPAAATSQTISITIAPGPFLVTPGDTVARLHRSGNGRHFKGTLGPVQVTDARGSLAGWVLTIALADGSLGRVSLTPSAALAVTGRAGEAHAGPRGTLAIGRPAPLMSATAEGGGGIFQIDASLDLKDGPAAGGDAIDVSLHLALT